MVMVDCVTVAQDGWKDAILPPLAISYQFLVEYMFVKTKKTAKTPDTEHKIRIAVLSNAKMHNLIMMSVIYCGVKLQ